MPGLKLSHLSERGPKWLSVDSTPHQQGETVSRYISKYERDGVKYTRLVDSVTIHSTQNTSGKCSTAQKNKQDGILYVIIYI